MDYKDMPLRDFAELARASDDELGAHDGIMWSHLTGSRWRMDDAETAIFLASARFMVLELVDRLMHCELELEMLKHKKDAK